MKVKGVSEAQIRAIAADLGFRLDNTRSEGRYFLFVLRMATPIGRGGWRKAPQAALRYRKRGYSSHMRGSGAFGGNGAVCFHGHKEFMERIFKFNPDAVIRTKMAAYLGLDSFNEQFPGVGAKNVGSMMYPLRYEDACDCDGSEAETACMFGTLLPPKHDGGKAELTNVVMIKHSDLKRCPFTILVASHYRADGSCKCDDPEERKMMIRDWEYTPESFKGIPLRTAAQ